MEQVKNNSWNFDVSPETAVVTSTYITKHKHPILYVTHEFDEEEGIIWQFHSGNNDYNPEIMQLVRLDEIIEIDSSINELANLPLGYCAKRSHKSDKWIIENESA